MNDNKNFEDIFDQGLAAVYILTLQMIRAFKPSDIFYLPLEQLANNSKLVKADLKTFSLIRVLSQGPLLVDPNKGTVFFENNESELPFNFKEKWLVSKEGKRVKVKHDERVLADGSFSIFLEIAE